MRRLLLYISIFCLSNSFGQDEIVRKYLDVIHFDFQKMNYRNGFTDNPHFKRNKNIHGNVRPGLVAEIEDGAKSPLEFSKRITSKGGKRYTYLSVYPLVDVFGGIEVGSNTAPDFQAGAGVGVDVSGFKWSFTAKALPYYSMNGYFRDSIQQKFNMDVGSNRALTNNVFYKGEFLANYRANKFFSLMGGYGQNFFGDGYRSMLLSDNAGAHPFFRIETSFAGIKYVNLYNFWRDNSIDPFNRGMDIPKFASTHYLSWNITKDFNFSVFEAVVFQMQDTLVNRGFDFNYINPIVFYRPVEYGLGSADNVLLGLSSSFKINDNSMVYSQFILDEFFLKFLLARDRWWANKYGWQIGYKSDNFIKDSLYFQVELNGARPFTFSHKSSPHAYGHMNAPVAHPIGANFLEILNITSYQKNKHRFTNKFVFATYGVDPSDTVSYGQNIFASYELRPGEFDQLMYQGIRTSVFNETFIYEYELLPKINMFLTAQYNLRVAHTSLGTDYFHTFSVGIRSRIWNSYSDF